jgi:ketosteroid isomerase-like protein
MGGEEMYGTIRKWTWIITVTLYLFSSGLLAQTTDELEASLLATEQAFAASAQNRDQDAFASFIAEGAVFAGGGPILRGREAIVQAWSTFFAPDGPRISWSPEAVAVKNEGTLGFTRGPYAVEVTGEDGEVKRTEGTFFSVWQRQGDAWKIVLDTGTQCLASAAAGGTEAEASGAQGAGALEGLQWLVGTWRGPGLGGECEEVWSASSGGSMMGMFRLIKSGKVSFYEIMTITEKDGRPHLRLKHFGSELKGWEEKDETVDFPFLSRTPDSLVFQGLAYQKDGDDGLNIEVELGSTEDASHRELIRLRRIPQN